MLVRPAKKTDLDQIWSIYSKVKLDYARIGQNDYDAEVQRRGFLVGTHTKDDILVQIENTKYFLVAEMEDRIVGYLRADVEKEYLDDSYKTWFDAELKDIYYNNPQSLALLALAVDLDSIHNGIGSALFHKIESIALKDSFKYLFTVITVSPITNCPMISWRTKVGFKRLAMGIPREELFGIKWYASMLMYKKI